MVEAGWGALFLISRSLPQNNDLNLPLGVAQAAWDGRRGAWAEFGETLLLGYEYRACIKLGAQQLDNPAAAIAEAYQRHCMKRPSLRTPYFTPRGPTRPGKRWAAQRCAATTRTEEVRGSNPSTSSVRRWPGATLPPQSHRRVRKN